MRRFREVGTFKLLGLNPYYVGRCSMSEPYIEEYGSIENMS